MNFEVLIIPIFEDNYVFILKNNLTGDAIIVDPGESKSVIIELERNGLTPKGILITHHHPDHIGGIADLKKKFHVPVYAPFANKSQIVFADYFVEDAQQIQISSFSFLAMALPGHTLGHLAYWFADRHWIFSGDVIFGLGCGRLFEGTAEQGFASVQKIKALPEDSLIYCAHEYTETNLRFCQSLKDPYSNILSKQDLAAYADQLKSVRSNQKPSVPLHLNIEKKINPFLVSKTVEDFRNLRQLRNHFR
jgi:hydroxyacylglutathione hydrolase